MWLCRTLFRFSLVLLLLPVLSACAREPDSLQQIKQRGELVVLTRNAATTYYESREGYQGVEYEMASAFAESLGVKVRFEVREDLASLFTSLENKEADLIAAGITRTAEREQRFLFGPTYQMVAQQLVCRRGGKRPKKFSDLVGISIKVPRHSSYIEQLKKVKLKHPEVTWEEVENTDTETLLEAVWLKKIDCTVADENIVAINRRYFPELSVRFNLNEAEPLAWVMNKDAASLQSGMEAWFEKYMNKGRLDEVMHRYYGFIEAFDYVDTRAFQRRIKSTLPRYEAYFKAAASRYSLPWTLLAAQSYQESHWRQYAKSPTGVRGMMMLTRTTAKELGIKNRLDAKASIMGGAYYLNRLKKRLPDSVTEPDRTWIALAAYNVGMGHIWDARKLAKQLGKNPDSWQELATVLPLLTKKKYYRKLKHGYARGYEPVSYVRNIRNYQDMLENSLNHKNHEQHKKQ